MIISLVVCSYNLHFYPLFRNRFRAASYTLSISLAPYAQALDERSTFRSQLQCIVVIKPLLGDLQGDGFTFWILVAEGGSWR